MLRHQLILRLGVVVVALVGVLFVGVWLLRGSFDDLNRVDAQRPLISAEAQALAGHIGDLESALLDHATAEAFQSTPGLVESSVGALDAFLVAAAESDESRAIHIRLNSLAVELGTDIEAYLSASESESVLVREQALRTLLAMRREAALIPELANELVSAQRAEVIARVHTVAVWLGVAIVVLTAAAGLVIYSAARLVLKPMSALLKMSRELSSDRFDARVPAGQPVEFAELANAYNLLAAKVQENEKKTLETLQQLAITLNHELNNAFAIVEMQLERLKRQSPDDPTLGLRLTEIRETLSRMTVTVKSLTNLKRVVLTEYVPGQKMLDLAKSIATDDATGSKEWTKAEVKINLGTSQTSARSS